MMFQVKAKPALPMSPAVTLSAEFCLQNNGKVILLPGVTKEKKELANLPVFKSGDALVQKTVRYYASQLKISIWYDLPLAEKKEALAVLIAHFKGDINEVARVLGHSTEYVQELTKQNSDDKEVELARKTKIESRVATPDGSVKDPMKFFEMDVETGKQFLEATRASWVARALDDKDPFIIETLRTADKVALEFLLGLKRAQLFSIAQVTELMAASERKADYKLLPELAMSLYRTVKSMNPILDLLFPGEAAVKAMRPEQISWRIQLVKEIEAGAPMDAVVWKPAFKGLPAFKLIGLAPHLFTDYVIENLNVGVLAPMYKEANKRGGKKPGDFIGPECPDADAKRHYFALTNWTQQISATLIRRNNAAEISEVELSVLLVRTAIAALDIKYYPPFMDGQLIKTPANRKALIGFLCEQVDSNIKNSEAFNEAEQHKSIIGRVFGSLGDDEKVEVQLYGKIASLINELSRTNVITRANLADINRLLGVLTKMLEGDEKAQIEALPFYKFIQAVATEDSKSPFSEFEITVIRGLLENSEEFFEELNADSFAGKILNKIVACLKARPTFAKPAAAAQAKVVPAVKIPPKGSKEEKKWLDNKVAEFDQWASKYDDSAKAVSANLKEIHHNRKQIEDEFKRRIVAGHFNRGMDPIYPERAYGAVCIHLGNGRKDVKVGNVVVSNDPDWTRMNDILEDILYRMLEMFAIALEWEKVDKNQDKLRDYFGRMYGYCIESRTRSLLDNTPGWATQVAMDDQETLTQNITKIVKQHQEYLGRHGQACTAADATVYLWAWYKGQSYQQDGAKMPIEKAHIEAVVDNLGLAETDAASLLAAAAEAQAAAKQGLQRNGVFPAVNNNNNNNNNDRNNPYYFN